MELLKETTLLRSSKRPRREARIAIKNEEITEGDNNSKEYILNLDDSINEYSTYKLLKNVAINFDKKIYKPHHLYQNNIQQNGGILDTEILALCLSPEWSLANEAKFARHISSINSSQSIVFNTDFGRKRKYNGIQTLDNGDFDYLLDNNDGEMIHSDESRSWLITSQTIKPLDCDTYVSYY